MDKNAIKKYAVWARRELIERVSQRAMIYGITAKDTADPNAESVNGHLLSQAEKRQRQALIMNIKTKGYEQVMEEVAYTWFNRFAAMRFMEVNGYLPSHIRVFTNDAGEFKPQILAEAIHLELDGLDMNKVYELESANKSEELFKYLLIVQCNALNSILPGLFQRIEDYTELLLPDYLLREGSVIEQMVTTIPEEDWTNQVQIIGWLYEGYNTDRNELVYDGNMSKSRITKDLLPAATTIFTPDWPIRYMVENSLGRLWLEGHPNNDLKEKWKYYLDEADQEPDVQARLTEIRKEYADLKPEDILVIDPCQGSGHILAYMFDVLVHIYESYGYSARQATAYIVENNLWGLDIDDRAAQLAYFSVMMKARQYDRRFFSRGIQPHVYVILESNNLDSHCIEYFVDGRKELKAAMDTLVKELYDAKEYGSILNVSQVDFDALFSRFEEIQNEAMPGIYSDQALVVLLPFVQVAQALAQKYHVVITNPPYLNSSRFSPNLDAYAKANYPDEKNDLSMVMLKRAMTGFSKNNGFISFITTSSWMVLASFENTRKFMFNHFSISSLTDFGTELFEGKVGHNPIVAWVNRNVSLNYNTTSIRLVDYCYSRRDEKEREFFNKNNRFSVMQKDFFKIPGAPVAYWIDKKFYNLFKEEPLRSRIKYCEGLTTANNDLFLRFWYEVEYNKTSIGCAEGKWVPYNKGGEYRKWYGNRYYVVDWEDDGQKIKAYPGSSFRNAAYQLREGGTYSALTSKSLSVRYTPNGCAFDSKGTTFFANNDEDLYDAIACMNSNVFGYLLKTVCATMDYRFGTIQKLPLLRIGHVELVKKCIDIAKTEWDSFEISWDFIRHPLVSTYSLISQAFQAWQVESVNRRTSLLSAEEQINSIIIDSYGLNTLLQPTVEAADVCISEAEKRKDIKSLISYAVGCIFGRYSLDVPGLVYAGGPWDASKYESFEPDKDAIVPICDDEYFADDLVGRFIKFVEVAYGKETLEENLYFIADALGGRGSSREVIRSYFINGFYADHLKVYQKRPIYWLFDSGKKNGFKCLIYMHRYQPDTIARIRTDYVHEQQSRYRTAIADLEQHINGASTSERVKLSKQLAKLQAQAEEIRVYEEKIHHLADQMIKIDLDDGVKHNYAIFKDVLAKIK